MNWIIFIFIGIGIGIMFSVASPETAQSINDMLLPTIESILDKIKEISNRFSLSEF